MLSTNLRTALFTFTFCVLALLQCSTELAGGAGAGNPATIAIVAEGANSDTTKTRVDYSKNTFETVDDSVLDIVLVDGDNMPIVVKGVFLLATKLNFPIPEGIDTANDVIDPLYIDSGSLHLDGPFVFDILYGTSRPPTSFNLPNGVYENVHLCISPTNDSTIINAIDTNFNTYEIIIKGTFSYEDTTRNITIFILCDTCVTFHAQAGGIILANENHVALLIELDEKEWLSDVHIKGCIKQGEVTFDDEGNLVIRDNPTGQGPSAQLAERIKRNIFNSGVFKREM